MTTVAIIPARGGSTRIPRKNIKDFHGKPIIAYSIEKAQQSGLFDRVVVSTDDLEIAEVARLYGADVYMRDPDYGRDHVGTQAVTLECIKGLSLPRTALVCCIYATAPLMGLYYLSRGWSMMRHPGTRFAFAVGTDPLHDAGQFYWGYAGSFLDICPLISPYSAMIPIPAARDCDINTPDDWERAEYLYSQLDTDDE